MIDLLRTFYSYCQIKGFNIDKFPISFSYNTKDICMYIKIDIQTYKISIVFFNNDYNDFKNYTKIITIPKDITENDFLDVLSSNTGTLEIIKKQYNITKRICEMNKDFE